MSAAFDWLIVGAGFAGSVLAERIATQRGESVLLVDRRNHIGGNAYDCHDDAGILVHRYGPHIFHTNSQQIVDHLSQFTAWRLYEHRVLSQVDGKLLPIPINLDTINGLYGLELTSEQLEQFFVESGIGTDEQIERVKQASHGLGLFVRSLVGLDQQAAKKAFEGFIKKKTFSASQIEFINLIINYLTAHGVMSPALLYETPFTDLSPQGPEGLFGASDVDELIKILTDVEATAA